MGEKTLASHAVSVTRLSPAHTNPSLAKSPNRAMSRAVEKTTRVNGSAGGVKYAADMPVGCRSRVSKTAFKGASAAASMTSVRSV